MTNVPTDVADFLGSSTYDGEKHPGFKFANVGDTLKGEIVGEPAVVEVAKISGEGKEKKLVAAVRDDNGNVWNLWAKGQMASAIKEACEKAGVTGIAKGGIIAVRFQEKKNTGKIQPLHVFAAAYQAPAKTTNMDEVLGDPPAQQQAAALTTDVADLL